MQYNRANVHYALLIMKPRINPDHFPELQQVLTLAQAAREYRVHRQYLSVMIDTDRIAAVRQGRNVLISRRSLESVLFPLKQ